MGELYEQDYFYKKYLEYITNIADSIQNDIPFNEKVFAAQRLIKKIIVVYFLAKLGILQLYQKGIQLPEKNVYELFVEKSTNFHKFIYRVIAHIYDSRRDRAIEFPDMNETKLVVPILNLPFFKDRKIREAHGKTLKESQLRLEDFQWMDLVSK